MKIRYIYLILFFVSFNFLGNDIKVTMSSDEKYYSLDDTISLSITIESSKGWGKIKKFPNPKGLMLLDHTRSSSQNIQIDGISGKTIKEIVTSYNLTYSASKKGKYKFPPVKVYFKGKYYFSNSLTVNVVESKNDIVENEGDKKFQWPFDPELFIVAKTDKQSLYVGEQLTVTYYLYHRIDVEFSETPTAPSFNNFWIEEIKKSHFTTIRRTKRYKGYYYKVTPLAQMALFPLAPGEYELPPFKAKFRADMFHSMFNNSPRSVYKRTSNYLKIKVNPLPKKDKPENFKSENVGKLQFSVLLSKDTVEVNEPISLKMVIKGEGNIRNISFPKIPDTIENFKIYEPVEKTVMSERSPIRGEKSYVVAIKPEKPGIYKPFNIKFSYFDPETKKYQIIDYNDLSITVLKSSTNKTVNKTVNSNNLKVKNDKEDRYKIDVIIKPIDFNLTFKSNLEKYLWITFFILIVLLPIIYLLLHIVLVIKYKNIDNQAEILNKKALKIALKEIKEIKENISEQSSFYQKIYHIIANYLNNKLSISIKGLTTDQIALFLEKKGVNEENIRAITNQIENSEFIRFSNMSVTKKDQIESADKVKEILTDIDRGL